MKKTLLTSLTAIFLGLAFLSTNLTAKTGYELAKELELKASSKAMKQWERIFKKERKMARYGIDGLTDEERKNLKTYLLDNSADSEQADIAGS